MREFRNSKKYMASINSLYGDAEPPKVMTKKVKTKANDSPLEDSEQMMLVKWLRLKGYFYFAIPNGSNKSIGQRMRFKALGLIAGVSDIFIGHPSRKLSPSGVPYLGLFLELKRQVGGVVSEAQREFMRRANEQGYLAVVACGCADAITIIEEYLSDGGNELG